jgi:phosphatidylserine decarboxylase
MVGDAYRFLIPILLASLVLAYLHYPALALLCLLLAAFVCLFFRNPRREIPAREGLVLSPADGKIVKITTLPAGADQGATQLVSIFLNIFDVHVNRSPIQGELENLEYIRGKFKMAFDEEASRVNEMNILTIRGRDIRIVVKQIAGFIARRVVCWKAPGHEMDRGEVIGLIRFGSRVDVLLPKEVRLLVKVGEKVKGGSSILGEYS